MIPRERVAMSSHCLNEFPFQRDQYISPAAPPAATPPSSSLRIELQSIRIPVVHVELFAIRQGDQLEIWNIL